jgi:hypothetical protein
MRSTTAAVEPAATLKASTSLMAVVPTALVPVIATIVAAAVSVVPAPIVAIATLGNTAAWVRIAVWIAAAVTIPTSAVSVSAAITIAVTAIPVTATVSVTVVPGAGTDKDASEEPVWAIEPIRRTSIGVVVVIAVGANGSSIFRAVTVVIAVAYAGPDANPSRDLGLGETDRNRQHAQNE